MAVVVAMLIFYQKEPVYTLVIVGVGLFFYLFYKAKKSGNGLLGTFLSGNQTSAQNRNFGDLMALIMLQQLLSNNPQGSTVSREITEESQKRREEIDKIQREVLDLLESD